MKVVISDRCLGDIISGAAVISLILRVSHLQWSTAPGTYALTFCNRVLRNYALWGNLGRVFVLAEMVTSCF